MQDLHRHKCGRCCWVIAAGCTVFEPLYFATDRSESTNKPVTVYLTLLSLQTSVSISCSFSLYPSIHLSIPSSHLSPSLPPCLFLSPPSLPPSNTGQIGKPWWRHRSWGRSYLSQTDQEVCDGGVDGCCRSVTLAGARQAGPHGSGTVGLQTDGTWWVTNN